MIEQIPSATSRAAKQDQLNLHPLLEQWEGFADTFHKPVRPLSRHDLFNQLAELHGRIATSTPKTWDGVDRLLRMIQRIDMEREADPDGWWRDFPVSVLVAAVMRSVSDLREYKIS